MQKASVTAFTRRLAPVFGLIDRLDGAERRRLRAHAAAMLLVAAAVVLKLMFGGTGPAASFALLNVAVAGAALAGGLPSAFLAALAAVLSARLMAGASWAGSAVFGAEAMLVAALIVYVRSRSEQTGAWLAEADAEVRDLRAAVRQNRLVSEAFDDLERVSPHHVAIVLSSEGAVSEWRSGAGRLYLGDPQRAIGTSAGRFFYPPLESGELHGLLDRARSDGAVLWRGVHQRFDGTIFDVEVQLRCLVSAAGTAFSMVVHDLTDRQAAEALARHAAARQDELREEATLAQEQLACLEAVADPFLNAVPGAEAVTMLLDRLRTQLNADGIAIVRRAGLRPRLFWAGAGIRPEPPDAGSVRDDRVGRALLIHNDEARVADMTVARWPAGVRSLIAVPLLQNGEFHATMEVVYQRGARSTDWEIALIQVAAARAATLLPVETYAGSGAVA